jgi:iron complex transport system substrate-binding protein
MPTINYEAGMTKRTLPFALLAGALALLGLAACGSSDDDEPTAGTPGTAAEAEGEAAFPVTIEHKYGETTIEEEPERVVSLGYTEQDAILAFGVTPVAVRYAFGPEDDVFFPWADDLVDPDAGDPVILARAEVNVEQIAGLDPDLILAVTAGLTEEEYDLLSDIAPVVVQPEEHKDFGTPWQVHTEVVGLALGQPERADELIAEVEALFAEVEAEHPEFDGRTFVLSGIEYEGAYPFHASEDPRSRFFTDLGLSPKAELDEIAGTEFYGTVSKEQAAMLDADLLLLQAGSPEERVGIEADPIRRTIPAVANGHALIVDGASYDALQFASVLSLPYLLEEIVPEVAAILR